MTETTQTETGQAGGRPLTPDEERARDAKAKDDAKAAKAEEKAAAKAARDAEVQAGKDLKAEEKAAAKAAKDAAKRGDDEDAEETWRPKAGRSCRFRFMTSDGTVHICPAKVTKVHKGGTLVDVEVEAVHVPGRSTPMVVERVVSWVPRAGVMQRLPAFDAPRPPKAT